LPAAVANPVRKAALFRSNSWVGVGKGIRQPTVRTRWRGRGSIGAAWWRGCLIANLQQQQAAAADVIVGADGVAADANVEGYAYVRV